MNVHIVYADIPGERDRMLPRMARLLASATGWTAGPQWSESADLNYAFPYLESKRWPADRRYAAYFTHREDDLPAKLRWWNEQARAAALRITSARRYAEELSAEGPTVCIAPPLDRSFFSPGERSAPHGTLRAGVSGFSYTAKGTQRKGEHILRAVLKTDAGKRFEWSAIGRGWPPLKTKRIAQRDVPDWYRSLDLYVCPSVIEGVPYGPLEALACGIPVVIPRGVGLLDELPDVPGIYRYACGDVPSLAEVLADYADAQDIDRFDRDALRATTERFTEEGWISGHMEAFSKLGLCAPASARELGPDVEESHVSASTSHRPAAVGLSSAAGIYVVAYGPPARRCAEKLIASVRRHLPGIPVAVASEMPLAAADVHVAAPDADLGGRTAKTRMWELAPQEWERVLYLDADIELTADVSFLFEALAAGWEMVCTKDTDGYDLIHSLFRRDSQEHELGMAALGSDRALQLAGGVVAFRRTENVRRFLAAWYEEWHRLARRDQGAMIRALYAHPIRLLVLGSEWNSFEGIFKGRSAGVLHHRGGPARRIHRWSPGRLDDPAAWNGNGQMRTGIKPSHAERAAALRAATQRGGLARIGGSRYAAEMPCPACLAGGGGCDDHPLPVGLVISGERPASRPQAIRQRVPGGMIAGYKGAMEMIEPPEARKKRKPAVKDKARKAPVKDKAR